MGISTLAETIREEEGARRAQSATAPHDAIPEEEQARRARALAAATPLIEQIRASDRQALRSAKTMEGRRQGRQRQRQLVRDFLERELTEANAPLRDRWEEVRRRLETEVTAGRIAAAIWMTASRKLRRLSTCECRATFPAPRDKSRVVLDGEPGRFVVWQNDLAKRYRQHLRLASAERDQRSGARPILGTGRARSSEVLRR